MTNVPDDLDLEEKFFITNAAQLQRWLPWLRMFRAFRIAIGAKCLLLGLVATLMLQGGQYGIERIFRSTAPSSKAITSIEVKSDNGPHHETPSSAEPGASGPFSSPSLEEQLSKLSPQQQLSHWLQTLPVIQPIIKIVHQILGLFFFEFFQHQNLWWQSLSLTLYTVLIHAAFGGAISRISACEMTGGQSVSLLQSLKFSICRLHSYLAAPSLTLIGLGICSLSLVVAGFLARIPFAGEMLLGIFWCVALLAGFFICLITLGALLGWPLMFATISVEATDAFDGLSRAFSYLFNRPWYTLFLFAIMTIYGTVLFSFVACVKYLSIQITDSLVSFGLGDNTLQPSPLALISTWTKVAETIPAGFLFCFFWVSITIIYLLLRHREDGTPFFVMGQDKLASGTLPLSGIPAAELREAEIKKASVSEEN